MRELRKKSDSSPEEILSEQVSDLGWSVSSC